MAGAVRLKGGRVLPAVMVCAPFALAAAAWMVVDKAPRITVRPCVTADGPLAWLGIHLALLREHPACGDGQYGLDAGPAQIAGIAAMVAVPTLLMNLSGVLGMIGIWVTLRMLPAKAINAVRRLWPRLPRGLRCLTLEYRPESALRPLPQQPLRPWQLDDCPALRRGPPVPLSI